MSVKNAKTLPKVYYGLHMVEGVAEYREPEVNDGKPYRIFIGEDTIKNMDPTFQGRPVYVQHVDQVDLANIQTEADGWVVDSFYNKADGKHWVKFIVVSDRGHEAVRNGWRLSNAYVPRATTIGGLWHGVEYVKEVTRGEYEHLAIVPNPRYEESIILTPEQFKQRMSEKELELKKLSNSKGEKSMFKLFKKTAVDNGAELESTSVTLPKSGKEMTLSQVINAYDEQVHEMGKPDHMANGEHHVMVGEEKMTVNALVEKHLGMMKQAADAAAAKPADEKVAEKPENEGADEKKVPEKKENEDGDGDADDKKENEGKDEEKEKEAAKKNAADKATKKANFEALKNAPAAAAITDVPHLELSEDRTARGKARYGSGK